MNENKERFVIGKYTSEVQDGIYQLEVSDSSQLQLMHLVSNPTYVTIQNDTNPIALFYTATTCGISYLDGTWKSIARPIGKRGACHVAVSDNQNLVSLSYFHDGCFEIYDLARQKMIFQENYYTQDSKIHYTQWIEDDQYLVVVDYGLDRIHLYDSQYHKIQTVELTPKSGPRHFVYQDRVLYVLHEFTGILTILHFDGQLTVDRVITISNSNEFDGSAIKLSSDKQFLFACSRALETIFVYQLSDIERIYAKIPTFGKGTRDFELSRELDFIVMANQLSHEVVVVKVNKSFDVLAKERIQLNSVSSVTRIGD